MANLTSADKSDTNALVDAAYDIAVNHSGIDWGTRHMQWRQPLATEVSAAGTPYLVVEDAVWAGFELGGSHGYTLSPDDLLGIGVSSGGRSHEVYDIPIWAIVKFTTADADTCFRTTNQIFDTLKQTFRIWKTLNGTAFTSYVNRPKKMPIYFKTGGEVMRAANLNVRCKIDLGWRI
jgi:hypothetical protein